MRLVSGSLLLLASRMQAEPGREAGSGWPEEEGSNVDNIRDHIKSEAFQAAHALPLAVYKATASSPATEQLFLTSQMRRDVVSFEFNIVEVEGEGAARGTVFTLRSAGTR